MKRYGKWLTGLLCILLCTVLLLLPAYADIGNAFDDGDIGGWDGGGFDFDFDNDYDFDFDDDYTYQSNGGFFFLPGGWMGAVVIVIIIIVFAYLKSKHPQTTAARPVRRQNPAQNLYGETMESEDSIIAKIQKLDPDFSVADFKAYVNDCYLKLQEAWEAKDWALARSFESDTLYNMHTQQIKEYIDQKKTNHLDSQCVLSTVLSKFTNDGKTETLVVKLNASLIDYVTDDTTGAVLGGSKTERRNRFYRLEFIRSAGTKTSRFHDLTAHTCPTCGAPLELTAAGRCEYCGNIITSGDYTWVLNAYSRWQ